MFSLCDIVLIVVGLVAIWHGLLWLASKLLDWYLDQRERADAQYAYERPDLCVSPKKDQ